MLVELMFASGQLPIVQRNTKHQVSASFTDSSSDILDLHSFMVPSSQDAEVRTRGGTDYPIGIVSFTNASRLIAMLFQIEVPAPSVRMGSREVERFQP